MELQNHAETIAYSDEWKKRLLSLPVSSAKYLYKRMRCLENYLEKW